MKTLQIVSYGVPTEVVELAELQPQDPPKRAPTAPIGP
jgi:hypothetical protein